MKVGITFWKDEVGGETEKIQVDLKPHGYRMAPITQWKVLIASEDKKVKKGEPVVLNVKRILIPEDTMIGPLHIMRHALGTVKSVVECGIPSKVEEDKCISRVLFIPIDDGEIKKNDLVGVLKVFFIRTGLLNRLLNIKPPKVELSEEIVDANITWRDNGNIHRKSIRTEVFGYIRTHIGVWEPLIADEDVEIKAGEITRIKIKEINLAPNTVVVPLPIMRNPLGTILDVVQLGKLSKVEEEKAIHQAIFLPIEDGKIEKGDLIGVINVYYVGVKELKPLLIEKYSQKVKMVYKKDGEIKRKEITIAPFGFRRKPVARWELLVADEVKEVKKGKPTFVKIKEIKIPRNSILYPFQMMRHVFGTFVDVCYDDFLWKVEEGGRINKALFLPIADGRIEPGDLLGIMNIYSVEVSSLERIKELYNKLVKLSEEERMAYIEALQ